MSVFLSCLLSFCRSVFSSFKRPLCTFISPSFRLSFGFLSFFLFCAPSPLCKKTGPPSPCYKLVDVCLSSTFSNHSEKKPAAVLRRTRNTLRQCCCLQLCRSTLPLRGSAVCTDPLRRAPFRNAHPAKGCRPLLTHGFLVYQGLGLGPLEVSFDPNQVCKQLPQAPKQRAFVIRDR